MARRKPIARTALAQQIHDELLEQSEIVEKTIMVDGEEVTVPVQVIPSFDPDRILGGKDYEVHDALNVVAKGSFGPVKES